MTVRLQNQGKRSIKFGRDNGDILSPKSVGVFSDKIGASLLRLYPGEVIDIDHIEAQFDHTAVKDFSESEDDSKIKKSKINIKSKKDTAESSDDDKLAAALNEDK